MTLAGLSEARQATFFEEEQDSQNMKASGGAAPAVARRNLLCSGGGKDFGGDTTVEITPMTDNAGSDGGSPRLSVDDSRFRKMLKFGVPEEGVRVAMQRADLSEDHIERFFDLRNDGASSSSPTVVIAQSQPQAQQTVLHLHRKQPREWVVCDTGVNFVDLQLGAWLVLRENDLQWTCYYVLEVNVTAKNFKLNPVQDGVRASEMGNALVLSFPDFSALAQKGDVRPLLYHQLTGGWKIDGGVWTKGLGWKNTHAFNAKRMSTQSCKAALSAYVRDLHSRSAYVTDAITGIKMDLASQTIFIQTCRGQSTRPEWDAKELARRLGAHEWLYEKQEGTKTVAVPNSSRGVRQHSRQKIKINAPSSPRPQSGGRELNRQRGQWFEVGYMVVARPGSGKTWMMQQVCLELCNRYLASDIATEFVPVLLSVQRMSRLLRTEESFASLLQLDSPFSAEIQTEFEAIRILEFVLSAEFDVGTAKALLQAYDARALVVLVDGIDEASSLSRLFESFGREILRSGNRVMMASRAEGIFYMGDYTDGVHGWNLLDLPELAVEQQNQIVEFQMDVTSRAFFKNFFEFQSARAELDRAFHRSRLDRDALDGVAASAPMPVRHVQQLSKLGRPFDALFHSSTLDMAERECFSRDEAYVVGSTPRAAEYGMLFQCLDELYDIAARAKTLFDASLDGMSQALSLRDEQVLKLCLKKPKRLLKKAMGYQFGGLGDVKDIVRASVVCDDGDQMLRVLHFVRSELHKQHTVGVKMVLVKNHFVAEELDFMHNRRVVVNLSFDVSLPGGRLLPTRHIVEVRSFLRFLSSFFLLPFPSVPPFLNSPFFLLDILP
jgi:hypothetical protein